ncbi:1,4-dihydroxy-2-naphthoate prenyltransferase [Flavobacteriaceae bacterium MAR_2010_188]|nr:1,4-dihydroxy-2-naphthoate prenyltransferase [Flavobacteriaceae bacterium MAR_2010_188]
MNNFKSWLSAIRLRTLPLSISGIILGSCFAYYNGYFKITILLFAILTTISLQILSNLSNDYGDGVKGTDGEKRVGPARAIQSGKITPDDMLKAIRLNIIVVIIFTTILLYFAFGVKHFIYVLFFFILACASIYAAMNYTIGEKAYGYRSLGDFFVFIFFGLLSVIGSYFLYTMQLDHHVFLPAIALGLLCVGVLNLNNMRDIDSDKFSNKITVAVRLGIKSAKSYHYLLIVGTMIITLAFVILYYSSISNLLVLLIFVPLIFHLIKVKKAKKPEDFDTLLKPLALSAFAFSLLLGIGYIL